MRLFAPQAQADLDDIVGWLLDHGAGAGRAEQTLRTVLDAAERLADRPMLGRAQPNLLPDPFRFWSIPHQRLILVYVAGSIGPRILRVLSTDRDLAELFAALAAEWVEPSQD